MSGVASPAGQIIFATASNRATLSRQAKTGAALRLAVGVYVVGASLPPESIAHQHRFTLIARYWPGAVLSGRSALSGGEPVNGVIYLAHPEPPRTAPLRLPGLKIVCSVGPGRLPGDMAVPDGLWMSGTARTLLENVHLTGRPPASRAGIAAVEDRIDTLARDGGPGRIATTLQQLDVLAGTFDPSAVDAVRSRLVAVLGSIGTLESHRVSPRLRARLDGQPFDAQRIAMLEQLVDLLTRRPPVPRHAVPGQARWSWLAFYEAYFSNYIEGTVFGLDQARAIAIDGEVPKARPQDAHDVAATFRLASDPVQRSGIPATAPELLEILQERHAVLMAARPDKHPGEWKQEPNFAGGYRFTDPAMVEGTLQRGFDVLNQLIDGFARAVGMMVLITEVHPFDDGNGRIARLMVNAELTAVGQARIIIPTVYRANYLAGLSGLSSGANSGDSLIAILDFAQRWTQAIDWTTYEGARSQLDATNAFLEASRAEADGLRLQLPQPHDTSPGGTPG